MPAKYTAKQKGGSPIVTSIIPDLAPVHDQPDIQPNTLQEVMLFLAKLQRFIARADWSSLSKLLEQRGSF